MILMNFVALTLKSLTHVCFRGPM